MVLDICIIILLIVFAVRGYKKGLLFTLVHTLGWIIALVVAFIGTSYAPVYIKKYTSFYPWFKQSYLNRFSDSANSLTSSYESLPKNIYGQLHDSTNTAINATADKFASFSIIILSFVLLFIATKVVVWIISNLLRKKYKKGARGFFDGFMGMIFGLVKGGIFVFLLLMLLVPAINLAQPVLTTAVTDQVQTSYFAQILYDNNFLLHFLKIFIK